MAVSPCSSQLYLEQPVTATAQVQLSAAPQPGDAELAALLRVQAHQQHPLRGHIGGKAEIMVLFHGMGEGDVPVLLHLLDRDSVFFVHRPGRQRLQLPAAAVQLPAAGGGQNITAVRAYIKFQSPHIASIQLIESQITGQKPLHTDAEPLRQRRQQAHVRAARAGLPFADRLGADMQRLRQLPLGHVRLLPQMPQQNAHLSSFHIAHLAHRIPEST